MRTFLSFRRTIRQIQSREMPVGLGHAAYMLSPSTTPMAERTVFAKQAAICMSQSFPDHLMSARLLLRRLRHDDAEALCAYRSLPEVARFQYWDSFGPEDAARLIGSQLIAEPNVPGTWLQLAIVKAETGCVIGDCGLHCLKSDPRQMEIGITLSPQFQGHRYADEAVECVLDYAFGSLDKHRVFAATDVLNRSAIGLCRRLGLRQEAHFVEHLWFKGRWGSEFVFAILKREWEVRRCAQRQLLSPNE